MSEAADKPHEPTAKKLAQAREKGEVARSVEVNTFALYLGILICLLAVAPQIAKRMVDIGGSYFSSAHTLDLGNAGSIAIREIAVQSGLFIAIPSIAIVLAIFLQRSAVMALTRLMPKLSRISPIAGAANKFGPPGLFEFAKSAIKMVIYTSLLGGLLWNSADQILASVALPPAQSVALLVRLGVIALGVVLAVAAGLAAIDFVWQQHRHLTKNRMSHQEMRDELKEAEGDPALKSRRRQRAEEIATQQMLGDVPRATVVVVNPTHFAVALRWSPLEPTPPICVAKGVDHTAAKIRSVAEDASVPIFQDAPTARALYATVDLGDPIPREHFQAVAAAIRFAEGLKKSDP